MSVHFDIDPKIKIKKIDDFLDIPHTILVNKFDEAAVKDFRDNFAKAVNTGQPVIPIVIDSYGGQVYSLMNMIDIVKSSKVPVATIATGKSMSCGSILFSCGAEGLRFMSPLTTLMIHDVSGGTVGKVEEMKVDAKECERLNGIVFKLMAQNIGQPDDYFTKLIHENKNADLFLSAEECKFHKIANHLRIPSFKVKVKTEITFE